MRRVLVVEDSAATRSLVRAILEDPGFAAPRGGVEVVEAEGGFDALRLLPRGTFDLVVSDVNMPGIHGLELVQFLRRSPQHTRTPVLLVSTQKSARDRARGLALGADAFLDKPFSAEALAAACAALLDGGRPPPAGGAP